MGILINRIGYFALELRDFSDPFETLLRAIVYQQLSGKAAATIHQRVLALFPGASHPEPAQLLRKRPATLRRAGLSNNKMLAIRDLATKILDGTVPSAVELKKMADEDIIKELTKVRGIGRWTAQMLLIFQLGRPDVLPADDLGIRKGYMRAYGKRKLPDQSKLEIAGRRWRPYRSIASWYLWRAADQDGL
ncbi:MAG: DNA-3-methyladenine glycosylase 2 family protein [Gammaproteobacteria bacterium]|nr:DNA-3-methyladenine glycosylase 2 family protein [Gammaproteobacteria bacterium]